MPSPQRELWVQSHRQTKPRQRRKIADSGQAGALFSPLPAAGWHQRTSAFVWLPVVQSNVAFRCCRSFESLSPNYPQLTQWAEHLTPLPRLNAGKSGHFWRFVDTTGTRPAVASRSGKLFNPPSLLRAGLLPTRAGCALLFAVQHSL